MGTAEQHRPEAGKGTGKSRLCQDQAEQGGESARRGLREVAQSRSQAPQRVPAGHPPAQTLCLGAQLLRLRVVSRWVACCLHCAGDRRGALASAQLPREIPSVELSASVRGGRSKPAHPRSRKSRFRLLPSLPASSPTPQQGHTQQTSGDCFSRDRPRGHGAGWRLRPGGLLAQRPSPSLSVLWSVPGPCESEGLGERERGAGDAPVVTSRVARRISGRGQLLGPDRRSCGQRLSGPGWPNQPQPRAYGGAH